MALRRFANLEPEQKDVLNVAMTTRHPVILVQGVAGSGKTTIALNTLLELFAGTNPLKVENRTAVLLTYSQSLRRWCYDQLSEALVADGQENWLSDSPAEIVSGRINIATYQDFLGQLLPKDVFQEYLPDADCIDIIRRILANHPSVDLLPSQLFTLITAFLKGRPEFTRLSAREICEMLESRVVSPALRHPMHNAYWSVIPTIAKTLYSQYQNELGSRKDRGDISALFLRLLQEAASLVDRSRALSVQDLDLYNLGRQGAAHQVVEWIHGFLHILSDDVYEPEANSLLEVLHEPTQEGVRALANQVPQLAKRYGMRGTWLCESARELMPCPFLLVDEVQDLSTIECRALLELWFQLPRDPASDRLMLLGDINQQLTPTGFMWDDVGSTIYRHTGVRTRFTYEDTGLDPILFT